MLFGAFCCFDDYSGDFDLYDWNPYRHSSMRLQRCR